MANCLLPIYKKIDNFNLSPPPYEKIENDLP